MSKVLSKIPDIKVTLCLASFNRLEESKIYMRRHAKFVDRVIVIDGGSWDGSIEYFNSEECKEMNVECYVHPWIDDPPGQRNKYLNLISDGWVLVLDCDELLELPALYKLKFLAREAEDKKITGVAFRAHDIQWDQAGGVFESLSGYYNRLFFKASPKMTYIGHTHVGLWREIPDVCLKTEYKYYHVKPWEDVYSRACRNYWTTSACAQNTTDAPEWIEFKKLTAENGFKYFYEFMEYLRKGDIDPKYKKWFIDQKENINPEARSLFVCYFMWLHPKENVDKISNRDVPYIEDRKPITLQY